MNLYEEQFSEKYNFPYCEKPSKTLVIASTGRCGSHMLGHVLYETGKFGFPLEYLNPGNLQKWKKVTNLTSPEKVIKKLQTIRTSENGVFAIKVHYPHLKEFESFSQFQKLFSNACYILLNRSDVLKQAVSLSIASQTGVYIAGQKPINTNPQYDFEQIQKYLKETIENNSMWRYTLAANGCNYIEMNFDEILSDLPKAISKIADFSNIDVSKVDLPKAPVTKKQGGDLNLKWKKIFIDDYKKSKNKINTADKKLNFLRKIKDMVVSNASNV